MNLIPPQRRKQFDAIEHAEVSLLSWARAHHIPLEHVEFVVPFVETDFSLHAVFFYSDRSDVGLRQLDGTSSRVTRRFMDALNDATYPSDWLASVTVAFASKQEVDENFEGSYFYYMR